MANQRTVILGITGSIAAYKAADIASQLVKAGHTVHCVMTKDATHFITPLTLETISRQAVTLDLFAEREWCPTHVAVADAADLLVIAPATANIIAKLAAGIADDALTTTLLSLQCPVILAPAMNHRMWANRVVQDNVARLRELGYRIVEPEEGWLACGEKGAGRLAEADAILAAAEAALA